MKWSTQIGVVVANISACAATHASIVYDGFSYPPGSYTISNPPPVGGSGFSNAPWSLSITMASPGLTHPSAINPTGGSARTTGSARGLNFNAANFRPTETYWASFLANQNGNNGSVLLQFSGGSTLNVSTQGTAGLGRAEIFHAFFGQPSITVASAPGSVMLNQTNFVLVRFSPRIGGQRVDCWINPPSFDALGAPLLGVDTAALNTSGLAIQNGNLLTTIDEIRMDRSLSGVMVPAPGAALPLLVGSVALLPRRRRASLTWPDSLQQAHP